MVVDFATSAVARGKLLDRAARGEKVPFGWVLDADGHPSDDPAVLQRGGMQLPMAGHKGFGMGLIAELISFAMLHTGPEAPDDFNWLMLALDIEAFSSVKDYRDRAGRYLERVRAVPPAEGFDKVMVPGEPERAREQERRRSGLTIPDSVWNALVSETERYGIPLEIR